MSLVPYQGLSLREQALALVPFRRLSHPGKASEENPIWAVEVIPVMRNKSSDMYCWEGHKIMSISLVISMGEKKQKLEKAYVWEWYALVETYGSILCFWHQVWWRACYHLLQWWRRWWRNGSIRHLICSFRDILLILVLGHGLLLKGLHFPQNLTSLGVQVLDTYKLCIRLEM